MKNYKRFLTAALSLSLLAGTIAIADEYCPVNFSTSNITSEIKSEKISAGTTLRLRMDTPVNSYNTKKGDTFRATLLDDVRVGTKVIIPAGTIVRGRTGSIKKNNYLSKNGKLQLSFDHIVTSMGKQIPLNAKISQSKYIDENGNLSAGGGYLNAVGNNIDDGVNFMNGVTKWSIDKGTSFWKGYPVIVTAPVGAAVGLCGAGGIFTVKSVVDIFQKGDNVKINPGDTLSIILKDPIDVPLN